MFATKLAGGKSFVQAAAEAGYGAADLPIGTRSKDEVARLSSPQVADAAFAAAQGGTTAPVRSPLGWHILRVDAVNVTPGRSLESVRGEIVVQIERRKSEDAIAALATKIEDSIADGASFEEVVRGNGLQAQETAPVTATGVAPDVPGYQFPAEANALLKGAFDLTQEDDPVVESIVNGQRYALVTLGRIVPAAPPPLAQIRGRVHDELVRERALNRTKALAQQITDKVNRGVPIGQAVAQAGAPLPPVQPVAARRMDLAQQGRQVPPPLQMIFSLPRGKARLLAGPNGSGWYVVRLDEIVQGDIANAPGLIEATRSQLTQVIGEEYAEQFARAATREVEVDRHDGTIARLKKQLESNAPLE
jgi:peptidyl-prolyl cis-trans isomerase D